jgi:hypothetical protein
MNHCHEKQSVSTLDDFPEESVSGFPIETFAIFAYFLDRN